MRFLPPSAICGEFGETYEGTEMPSFGTKLTQKDSQKSVSRESCVGRISKLDNGGDTIQLILPLHNTNSNKKNY